MLDWADVISKVIIPAVAGGIAGWFAPWRHWEIEKRRQVLERRRELVTAWRMKLIPMVSKLSDWNEVEGRDVLGSPYHASQRPHLSAQALAGC